jgi:hypothetical protein
MGAAISQESP